MFTLQPKPTFEFPVVIRTPEGDATIRGIFKHKGRKALKAFYESLGEGDTARSDLDALLDVLDGWLDVDTKFSPDALETMLDNYPTAARAFFDSFNKGLFEGKQKNS